MSASKRKINYFWNGLAQAILSNRIIVSLIIIFTTIGLMSQWSNIQFSFTETNLLPDDHPVNIEYNKFFEKFGEEGVVIVMAVNDSTIFNKNKFNSWVRLNEKLQEYEEVDFVVSFSEIKELTKTENPKSFTLTPVSNAKVFTEADIAHYKQKLFNELPFYEGLIYSSSKKTIQSALYIRQDVVNTRARRDFILKKLNPVLEQFEKDNNIDLKISGMPYIRTMNSQNIFDEMKLFLGAALLVTSLLFFFFFRSARATLISIITVVIGVLWAFGFIGLFHFQITVLTAIIPPLVIVIGIPNCIFLINKYQQEIKKQSNKNDALVQMISKVGYATLMTNVTTAAGFATFILTSSELLVQFGMVSSVCILGLFVLCILVIPLLYSIMPLPKDRHLKHLEKRWVDGFVNWMVSIVSFKRNYIYAVTLVILVLSIIGMNKIKVSGSLLEEMSQELQFFHDIKFFENEFDGIMPLEILVDTKKPKGVLKLSTLKRIEKLSAEIEKFPELSPTKSVVNIVKFAKQAFYNGDPKFYSLPTRQERNFMLPYAKSLEENKSMLSSYVDSTGQYARVSTYMKDVGTEKMEEIETTLKPIIEKIFPKDRYSVSFTGRALIFQKGTGYLVTNLMQSLLIAIGLIILIMGYMFKSVRMILISLIPNLLPLLITGGLMGYFGVPIKPSTILVFSIAFGISVDDTIHFLAKYRQELLTSNRNVTAATFSAIRETGVSMFYTSTVLFFGFAVFLISSFGGTKALGGLISATLLFAMLCNLVLLPALLLSVNSKKSTSKA
ncbi:efflux RND transporter permease subunit [Aquimarina agarilytica]|uniref:efflux RND transporter permease subunit n=1 Tax=Aquimarina agarilytica TaxID=1087449 RepID=UPI000289DA89|nr:efflux RND transporter permease subunit [Aquimarina agarilytica]